MRLKLDSEKLIFLLLIVASGSKRENNMALNLYLLLMLPLLFCNLWLQNNFQSYRSLWEKHHCPVTV